MTKLTPIKFAAIYDAGRSHPPLLGQFVRDQARSAGGEIAAGLYGGSILIELRARKLFHAATLSVASL